MRVPRGKRGRPGPGQGSTSVALAVRACARTIASLALLVALGIALRAVAPPVVLAEEGEEAREVEPRDDPPAPASQTPEQASAKSESCVACHAESDRATMHANAAVVLGCTDCHGGNSQVGVPKGCARPWDDAWPAECREALDASHVAPRYPERWGWPRSKMPPRTYTLLNRESPDFVRFVNPSDLRVADKACGACHSETVEATRRSLMSTTAMLWGGAAYNNGILPFKRYIVGEAYTSDGSEPASIPGLPGDDTPEALAHGILPKLLPLPRWETIPPADNFRVFERGGRFVRSQFPEIGLPNPAEDPGRPDNKQSNRGPGTGSRISVPVLNIHKTRLNDPTLWFMGTSDHPGDYRSSGCAACHTPYANDRELRHSGPLASYGNQGETATKDPTIPRGESGHPIRHEFTRGVPTSQCMICHMHQPNMFVNSYLGFTMWDYEPDAKLMWPAKQVFPTEEQKHDAAELNPEGAAVRGLWGDPKFLDRVWTDVNPKATETQFADYHGHGWNFRAVFKRSRDGTLLDAAGRPVSDKDPRKFDKAVHLRDIHAEKGLQCADCHFSQDAHGRGHLEQEVAAAVEIRCQDCHGTVDSLATLRTSGPAAQRPPGCAKTRVGAVAEAPCGRDLSLLRNPDGRLRFEWRDGKLFQRPIMDWKKEDCLRVGMTADCEWQVKQVRTSVDPSSGDYNPRSARAKKMAKSTSQDWSKLPPPGERAHDDDQMTCFACHSSWMTGCAGCHLPVEANKRTERHHYEGGETRNYATYNPQVARDDFYILGHHGQVKDGVIAPVRSSSALVLSSTDINRNRIYVQQGPTSAAGFSAQAFAPHFPHTVRTTETKGCADCHLSEDGDNNAIMAQVLGLGTNFVNFLGLDAWVGTGSSVEGIQVTEWDEPQAVIGSHLHRYAYPDWWREHVERGRELRGRETDGGKYSHHAGGPVRCLQVRGEYLYAAEGEHGTVVYDVANIANKNFSERIVSAPFSPAGQDIRIESRDATCVVLPTTQPIRPDRNAPADPARDRLIHETNLEQRMHPVYRYAAITDAVEGLILADVTTMGDFEPRNNFLHRDVAWNPDGLLDGARHAAFAGHVLYVVADRGIVVVDLDEPTHPVHRATIPMAGVQGVMVQFRYLFAVDGSGLRVVDVTEPFRPRVVEGAFVPIANANRVFVSRTYAYVAAGPAGIVIVDVERPEHPREVSRFDGGGRIRDARDVVVASTNASLFAYVANGDGGLAVVQLISPETQPKFYGFSPAPRPELIAWRGTDGPALALSRPLERDRAVDETGGQIAIFGRVGSRPFHEDEMRRFYLDGEGKPWFVSGH